MYICHALINALSVHMIHINLNMIFYTHVELISSRVTSDRDDAVKEEDEELISLWILTSSQPHRIT